MSASEHRPELTKRLARARSCQHEANCQSLLRSKPWPARNALLNGWQAAVPGEGEASTVSE